MKAPNARLEVAGIDSLILRLFDSIDESNMPWMLAASQRLRASFGDALIDLVPSYTTLLLHYDLKRMAGMRVRELIAQRGLGDRFLFLGRHPEAEMPAF